MVVERYLRVEKAKIKPKNKLMPNKSLQGQTRPKRTKKCQYATSKFSKPNVLKKAKFDLFGLTQKPNGNPGLSLGLEQGRSSVAVSPFPYTVAVAYLYAV